MVNLFQGKTNCCFDNTAKNKMKYFVTFNLLLLSMFVIGFSKDANAQLCSGTWALQRPLTSQCVIGQWVGWQNMADPPECPIAPAYVGTQVNTFTFTQPVNTFTFDFRGTDGNSGCARIEVKVNGVFYPLTNSNLFDLPLGTSCTSGSFSNITLTPQGYITISGAGGPSIAGFGRVIINNPNTTSFTVSTNDPFGTVFSNPFNCSDVIPIVFERFTGVSLQSCKAKLFLHTGIELNVRTIEMEQSRDNINFEKVGEFVPRGSNSSYSLEVIHSSDAFYRLKAIDFDGTSQYSEIIFIKASCNQIEHQIRPNPATSFIEITNLIYGDYVRLFDFQGRKIAEFKNLPIANRIDISPFASSMYILQIIRAGTVIRNIKFVKK